MTHDGINFGRRELEHRSRSDSFPAQHTVIRHRYAAEALGTIVPTSADIVGALILALTDSELTVRLAAISALASVMPLPSAAMGALASALHDPNENIRAAAARAIAGLGPMFCHAVPELIELLSDPFADVRSVAATALGEIGSAAVPAIPALLRLLDDYDGRVEVKAAEALARIGEPAIADLLRAFNKKSNNKFDGRLKGKILKKAGAAIVPSLLQCLSYEDIRALAAYEIGTFRTQAAGALPALLPFLADPAQQFLALVGASGTGKSSLLFAGLLPALGAGSVEGSRDWIILKMTLGTFGNNPFLALAAAVSEALPDPAGRTIPEI